MSALMSTILVEEAHITHTRTGIATRTKNEAPLLTPELLYYAKCSLCGATASACRWPFSPLELIKTRMQAHPAQNPTFYTSFTRIVATEGWKGLLCGLSPTAIAYALQTGTKYTLYEAFKQTAAEHGYSNGAVVYMASAAMAEAVADVLMCPWEMIKVKMQTEPRFPQQLSKAAGTMWHHRHYYNFPFGSLGPLMGRQIPATVVNFCTFELSVQTVYRYILTHPKDTYSKSTQLAVSMGSGFLAGAVCAAVSHPADSIVSRMNGQQTVRQIVRQTGWYNLATQGLGTRMFLTGGIISVQWFLYDGIRTMLNMGTTGGSNTEE